MFIRFITSEIDDTSQVEAGIFTAAYNLHYADVLLDYEQEVFADIMHWFDEHLPAPNRFSRSVKRTGRAICWFRSSAREHVRKIYELIALVENHRTDIRMIKAKAPGYIVYEDEYQIAAEPFADIHPGRG